MVAKTFLICAQAFLIQCTLSQCINRGPVLPCDGLAGPGLAPGLVNPGLAGAYGGCGCGVVTSTGGAFPVNSISPLAPTGLSVVSENSIEGTVLVRGALPFLSAVVVDGVLPTSGTGTISYGCGNGALDIVAERPIAGIAGPAYGPALAGPAFGPGLAPGLGLGLGSVGCGCAL